MSEPRERADALLKKYGAVVYEGGGMTPINVNQLGNVETTERGFELVRFTDLYGVACTLQQSSAAIYEQPGLGAIWLGVGDNRMHLSDEQVESLIAHLLSWLGRGSFRFKFSENPEP